MKKIIFKIIELVIIFVFVFLIVSFGAYIVQRLTKKEEPAKLFGYYLYEVGSWSMYSEDVADGLSKGDLIFVKKRKKEDYQVGMVITYQLPEQTRSTTHKIIKVEGDIITTQGISDNNTSPDTPFDKQYVIGEVKGVWRNYSGFMNFLQQPLGIITVLVGGFLVIEIVSLIEKKIIKKKEEN